MAGRCYSSQRGVLCGLLQVNTSNTVCATKQHVAIMSYKSVNHLNFAVHARFPVTAFNSVRMMSNSFNCDRKHFEFSVKQPYCMNSKFSRNCSNSLLESLLKTNCQLCLPRPTSTLSARPQYVLGAHPHSRGSVLCRLLPTSPVLGLSDHRHLSMEKMLRATPASVQPYLRLIRFDKPIGTYLLFWPCTWSIGLAATAGSLPSLYLITLFGLGSFIMRGAGCIINDMWDKDIDAKVERTKSRPLASGELTYFQALSFLGLNLSLALGILLQLNWYSIYLGASSMLLVVAYPLAKRFTYWPQVLLGLTFNYGAMVGWCAVKNGLDVPVLPLYAACICWTLFYDTIYAHQDKYYDMLIGVKSTALKFGDRTKLWLTGFGSAMIGLLGLTGHLCDQTWPYYVALSTTAAHLAHQLYTVDLDNPDDCMKKFKANTQLGAVMFVGIVLGTLLKPHQDEGDEEDST
ncbi:4-hydroxybenzoate polyprenyltransferase, mitochondrial-like isoform X2 [Dreissena polymorpha]|uniref:4-hydroxybenzoate polyprenyltransferase, mitochondrial-like isoform X2 n=1 Tax=Dreissena polymorpha TaxID=45954 RepID=UPI0022647F6D|nr:4-hydroxybenzoate polyprenyltransferase, mitochondrial-like isoform X2 [Dreissena polymorpha]XP_052213725.1 4-hydroxybenzoate polyprenyltransferase, mitochondrial-like isoform X2 [Dreissena polymorpha]XP_052213726.1 4-hydroxybenzoate polyprenyltransferase, mitochondrial-like isoform X2 [Dreissena polymorpha]XP_052213727.1 4-hydroxybenzoate polyprenyltransferase, mitochondrial-like isoform X2 [Dreissena polymorpha]